MHITQVRIKGFKAFRDKQVIDLTNCNLLYGENSAGKSTISQAIRLLKQNFTTPYRGDAFTIDFRTPDNDLGGFGTVAYQHVLENTISIGLTICSSARIAQFFVGEISIDLGLHYDSTRMHTTLGQIRISDDIGHIEFALHDQRMRLADARDARSLVDRWQRAVAEMPKSNKPSASPNHSDLSKLRRWLREHEPTGSSWIPIWAPDSFGQGRPGRPFGGRLDSPQHAMLTNLVSFWESAAFFLALEIRQALHSVSYVGPLREFPKRVATEASAGSQVGPRGERMALYLARNEHLLPRINSALESLGLPYDLSIRKLNAQEVTDVLGEVAVLLLTERDTGLVVTPSDVGFGVSQVLPVIVHLLAWENRTILIEQPEIHLHPRLQGRLGDIMLKSIQENNNTLLVETHSEHLLARLQRRIREGALSASSLGLNYIQRTDYGSEVVTMTLNDQGDMTVPWPLGFFDEVLDDMFAGR